MKTKTKEWSRDMARPIPAGIMPIEEVRNPGEPAITVSDQADAATGHARTAHAWPVTDSEWRRYAKDGVIHSDRRDCRVGWAICVITYSRWEGEGVSREWFFSPGEGEGEPHMPQHLDLRWGDASKERQLFTPAIRYSRIAFK